MIRRLIVVALLAVAVSLAPAAAIHMGTPASAAATVQLPMFDTEAAAQAHCPKDVVVWLNMPTRIYHEKGMRWYARTKHGAYVCKKEADAAGFRDTRNGQ